MMHKIIEAAVTKFMNENGAEEICKTFAAPMAESIEKALESSACHSGVIQSSPMMGGKPVEVLIFSADEPSE